MKMFRTLALVVGVLGVAFVVGTPAVEAGGIPAPKEVARKLHQRAMTHVNHVDRFVNRAPRGSHDRYRRDSDRSRDYRANRYQRYPRGAYSYPRSTYYGGYARPRYGYPVIVGGYRRDGSCGRRGYDRGYVGAPVIGFSLGLNSAPPAYRDDACNGDCQAGSQNDDRYSDEEYSDGQASDDQLSDDPYSGDQDSDDQSNDDQYSDDDYDE